MSDGIRAEVVRELLRESEDRIALQIRDLWKEMKSQRDKREDFEKQVVEALSAIKTTQEMFSGQLERHTDSDEVNFGTLQSGMHELQLARHVAERAGASAGAEEGARVAKRWGTGIGVIAVAMVEVFRQVFK